MSAGVARGGPSVGLHCGQQTGESDMVRSVHGDAPLAVAAPTGDKRMRRSDSFTRRRGGLGGATLLVLLCGEVREL